MATYKPVVIATLTGPGALDIDFTELSLSVSLDEGWSWSATCVGPLAITWARDAEFVITIDDGLGNTLTSPPLIAVQRSQIDSYSVDDPDVVQLSGVDRTTFRMGKPNQSFASQRDTTSGAVLTLLGARVDVTINGDPDFYITEEEIKGSKLCDALARILAVSANDSVVETDGTITCTPWETDPGDLSFDWTNRRHEYNPTQIYTGVRIGKRSSIPDGGTQYYEWDEGGFFTQSLDVPLYDAVATDVSMLGTVGAVAFLDASSNLISYQMFDPAYPNSGIPFDGVEPATQFTIVVDPPGGVFSGMAITARVRVDGLPDSDPPPAGVDREFLYPEPNNDPDEPTSVDTSLGSWPAESDFIDPLFPGEAYGISRYPYILAKLNAPGDTVHLEGPLDVGVWLNLRHSYGGNDYKVQSITWDVTGLSTEITCWRV